MRHNGQKPINLSALPAGRYEVRPGERAQVACLCCPAWRVLRRGMVPAHRAADGLSRCPGSGQRIISDVSPAAHQALVQAAGRQADLFHGSRTHRTPAPAAPTPVCRMGSAA